MFSFGFLEIKPQTLLSNIFLYCKIAIYKKKIIGINRNTKAI